MRHFLIDTDPGVDDALAIMMALAAPDVMLHALTIAAGNVGLAHTVGNALKLVEALAAETPVFAGCPSALVRAAPDAAFVHGQDGFGDTGYLPSSRQVETEHAALAILRLSHQLAGRLTIVALGPLTNLAVALKLDATLPQRIERLVVMGGAVTGRGNTGHIPAEFNIGFDPEAAHIVFSAWPHFELVDWEATVRHGIDFSRFEPWLEIDHPAATFYRTIVQKTLAFGRARGEKFLTADALAMAVAVAPDLVIRAEQRPVAVELGGDLTRGATVVDWDKRSGCVDQARIVLEVDQAGFEAWVARALGGR